MRKLLALAALLAPSAALAHTGIGAHGAPFVSGLLHPLLGPDHLLAMVAVGIFAAMTGGRAVVPIRRASSRAMLVGGFLGFGGAALPVIEPTILASVDRPRPRHRLRAAPAAAARLRGDRAVRRRPTATRTGSRRRRSAACPTPPASSSPPRALHGLGLALGFAAGGLGRPALVRALGALTALAGLALVAG